MPSSLQAALQSSSRKSSIKCSSSSSSLPNSTPKLKSKSKSCEVVSPLSFSCSFPNPYSLCGEEECRDRQSQMQVSEWEATHETAHKSPKYRIIDPRFAVAKYRRSAAGQDVRRRPPRSLSALQATLQHLFSCLQAQIPPNHLKQHAANSQSRDTQQQQHQQKHQQQQRKSFTNTATFLDDRIRAIQVDLVISQNACGTMQWQLARYHLLSLYLLSDIPRKLYEPKFAITALWTAFSAYWNVPSGVREDDEIMCLSALCRIASILIRDETALPAARGGGGGWNDVAPAGYSILSQDSKKTAFTTRKLPKWTRLALGVASAAHSGFYHSILTLLAQGGEPANVDGDGDDPFSILCRCCLAPALHVIRLGALRQYNTCLGGKQEKITGKEMARLLHLPDADAAVTFCQSVGLPIDCEDWDNPKIITKAAPISITDKALIERMQKASRTDDMFVFGPKKYRQILDSCSDACDSGKARIDQDGVLVPQLQFFQELLMLQTK